MMACLRLMSCPCRHLFVGTPTINAHTDGTGSTDRSIFLAFQQQRFLIQVLFVCGFCATSLQRFVILSVLANGHLFHDVLSDMSLNPDHKSFVTQVPGYFLFRSHQRTWSLYPSRVIGVAPPTSPSDEEHHQTPIGFNPFGVSLATHEGAAKTISIAILSWKSNAINCSCFGIHLPHCHNEVLCRFGPCTP